MRLDRIALIVEIDKGTQLKQPGIRVKKKESYLILSLLVINVCIVIELVKRLKTS